MKAEMDPLSNQFPPYSPYDIDVFVYQKPHKILIKQEVEAHLPTPFDLIKTKESKQAELKKKKQEEKRQKSRDGDSSSL